MVEKPELKPFLKVLLDGLCLLESSQWKCKRGEVSRLAVFCSLLFILTLSVRPLRPVIQVVCTLWRPLSLSPSPLPPPLRPPCPPHAHQHARHQRLPLRAVVSSLHQSHCSAAMGISAWANEQHLFLSSVAVDANHNTHFIWLLSCGQSQHVIHGHPGHERHRQKEIWVLSLGNGPSRKWVSQHKCHSKCVLHRCIIGKSSK